MATLAEKAPGRVNRLSSDRIPSKPEDFEKWNNWMTVQNGSVTEIARLYQRFAENAQLQIGDRQVGAYEFYKLIADELPEGTEVHESQQLNALRAALESNPYASRIGKEAFFLLKIRTIINAVDKFFVKGRDNEEDRDDMTQAGVLVLVEKLSSIDQDKSISKQASSVVQNKVREWVEDKEGMPGGSIRNIDDRRNITEVIDELSEGRTRVITLDQIKKIIGDERFSHIPVAAFAAYIRDLNSQIERNRSTQNASTKEDGVFELTARVLLEDDVEKVLQTLNGRERRVIRLIFDLVELQEVLGRERTKAEVAKIMNLSWPTVDKAYNSAMRKLRRPIRSRKFRGYLEHSFPRREIKDYYTIDNLNLDEYLKLALKAFGIVYVEDFLQKEPEKIMEAWKKARNDPRQLILSIGETFFNSLPLTSTFEALHLNTELDPEFLGRIINKMLSREDISDLLEDLRVSGIPEKEKRREIFKYGFRKLWEFYAQAKTSKR